MALTEWSALTCSWAVLASRRAKSRSSGKRARGRRGPPWVPHGENRAATSERGPCQKPPQPVLGRAAAHHNHDELIPVCQQQLDGLEETLEIRHPPEGLSRKDARQP